LSADTRSDQKQKLEYMRSIIREVRDISGSERCDMVTYFLELAYLEVSDLIRQAHTKAQTTN
jgi:hypothetical protein